MKLQKLYLILIAIFLSSCALHFDKSDYRKFASKPMRKISLPTDGFYFNQKARYQYFSNGYRYDSLNTIYNIYIILFEDGKAYVDLNSQYDGMDHSGYNQPSRGENSTEAIHRQFSQRAESFGLFKNQNGWPGYYRMYNDSLVIISYQGFRGDSELIELRGYKTDSSTFKLVEQRRYLEDSFFGKPNIKPINMIYRFKKHSY